MLDGIVINGHFETHDVMGRKGVKTAVVDSIDIPQEMADLLEEKGLKVSATFIGSGKGPQKYPVFVPAIKRA